MNGMDTWAVVQLIWQVVTKILAAVLVWYVLSHLHSGSESVIVPILGMIYTILRQQAISLAKGMILFTLMIDNIQQQLSALSDKDYCRTRASQQEVEQMKSRSNYQTVIEELGVSAIFLICLWYLGNTLWLSAS